MAVAAFLHVLLDLVEHHDRVVERVPQNREDGDHRRRGHFEPDHGVDARGEDQVIAESDQRSTSHFPLEAPRHVHGNHEKEHDQGANRRLGDLAPEGGAYRLPGGVGRILTEEVCKT